jgi:hypothetical protein
MKTNKTISDNDTRKPVVLYSPPSLNSSILGILFLRNNHSKIVFPVPFFLRDSLGWPENL